jgi:hypothetical protein
VSGPQRWPKGPFPEKYRCRAVHDRFADAWSTEAGHAAMEAARALGLAPHPHHTDPYVRLFLGASDAALEAMRTVPGVTAFQWAFGTRDDRVRASDGPVLGLAPTPDPIEALVLVGVSGPTLGIGTAAIARFLTTLRSFSRYRLEVLGEERIELSITPKSEDAARQIADRMRHVCPPLGRAHPELAPIVAELMGGRFVMDFR